MTYAIIGGGAAGIFSALFIAYADKTSPTIVIYEKNNTLGRKILISGSGRCNYTNNIPPNELVKHYNNVPFLKGPLYTLTPQLTMKFFEKLGMASKEENENRVFPLSNSSRTVLETLEKELKKNKVKIIYNSRIVETKKIENHFCLKDHKDKTYLADKLIITSGSIAHGGSSDGYTLAKSFGHTITPLKGSLAPVKVVDTKLSKLSGTSVESVVLSTNKIKSEGKILITHDGLSGPVVLNHSRHLTTNSLLTICWVTKNKESYSKEALYEKLISLIKENKEKSIVSILHLLNLPLKLANHFVKENVKASTLDKDSLKKLVTNLCEYKVTIRVKEHLAKVTSGGISLKEVDKNKMESLLVKDLYFAGEVLDIDGPSGGYNLQAAWSTASFAAISATGNNPFTLIPNFITLKE
jgi:predicted Rossmann fold flavoprotein